MAIFLTTEDVILLHNLEIADAPVIDYNKLDSAVNRPANIEAYEPDAPLHRLAAALFEGISQAHGFQDGNKRTAVLATVTFYALNGYDFDAPDAELIHLAVDLTTHLIDIAKAADMLQQWAVPIRPHPDDQPA